jgi:hypothetical protein
MPRSSLTSEFDFQPRNEFRSKVDVKFNMSVDGRELPNLQVLGNAFEKAVELFQAEVKKAFEVVPPRDNTPMSDTLQRPAPPTPPTPPVNGDNKPAQPVAQPAQVPQAQPTQPTQPTQPAQSGRPYQSEPVAPAPSADFPFA